jgi:hypothetical protein
MDLKEAQLTNYVAPLRHPWELARVEVVFTLLKKQPELFGRKQTALDIGCGDVFLVEQLWYKMHNMEFIAIDTGFTDEILEAYNNRFAKNNIAIKVFKTLDGAFSEGEHNITLVLLLDVIEHIDNDVEFLRQIQDHPGVDSDTIFLITAPAYQSLYSSHDRFLKHHRRYNISTLESTTTVAGLTSLRKGYFFSTLLPFRIGQVLLEKITKPSRVKGIGDWKGIRQIDALLKQILVVDFRITNALHRIGIRVPGLSSYIVCKTTE